MFQKHHIQKVLGILQVYWKKSFNRNEVTYDAFAVPFFNRNIFVVNKVNTFPNPSHYLQNRLVA